MAITGNLVKGVGDLVDSTKNLVESSLSTPDAPQSATELLMAGIQGQAPSLLPPDLTSPEVASVDQGANTVLDASQFVATGPGATQTQTGQSTSVDPNQVQTQAPQVTGSTIDEAASLQAAQGAAAQKELEANELVSNQITELTAGLETGQIPVWAQPAVAAVEDMLARRGLSASSIGRAQLSNAIIQSAMPIAQANAAALQRRSELNLMNDQQMRLANLSNEQQAGIINAQNQQQVLLSNQASENAAMQFNATSELQTQQFNASMKANIELNNAARLDAMDQFNSGQTNAMRQFNAQMDAQIEQFNIQNATAIAQSNVAWRRQANLADTAAQNAANMFDASSRFQLTSQDLANRWQSTRDLAHWAFQSDQNALDRVNRLAVASLQSEAQRDVADTDALGTVIGYGIKALLTPTKEGESPSLAGQALAGLSGILDDTGSFISTTLGGSGDLSDDLIDLGGDFWDWVIS